MTYGGLRGAVSLAMALMLDADVTVNKDLRDLVVFHTGTFQPIFDRLSTVNKDLRDLVVFHTGTLFGDLSSAGMFY